MQEKFKGFTFVGESSMEKAFSDREDLERMEEDSDPEWEKDFGRKEPGDRMSGIVSSADDDIFNHDLA